MNRFGFFSSFENSYRINENQNQYVVINGDSLYKIGLKYNISPDELIKYNNLENTVIYPGQVIAIPVKGINGATYFEEYMIGPGESIENIANKVGVSSSEIAKYNDITKLILQENQIINIPKNYKQYQIVMTDSLESILKRTNMTLEELVEANSSEWLKPGNVIYVKNN